MPRVGDGASRLILLILCGRSANILFHSSVEILPSYLMRKFFAKIDRLKMCLRQLSYILAILYLSYLMRHVFDHLQQGHHHLLLQEKTMTQLFSFTFITYHLLIRKLSLPIQTNYYSFSARSKIQFEVIAVKLEFSAFERDQLAWALMGEPGWRKIPPRRCGFPCSNARDTHTQKFGLIFVYIDQPKGRPRAARILCLIV